MLISTCKIFKDKIRQFVILTKFAGACYTKLQEKPCHDLLIICVEKKITKARQTKFCMLFVIFICYNFAHVLHENALVFSQSEVRNFFNVHYF